MKKLVIGCWLMCVINSAFAQKEERTFHVLQNNPNNFIPSYITFGPTIQFDNLEDWIIQNLNANQYFNLRKIDSNKDIAGNIHIRYQQYFQGLPVIGTMLNLHCKTSSPFSFNGDYYPRLSIDVTASINEKEALASAIQYFSPNALFAWDNQSLPLLTAKGLGMNKEISSYPKAELVIVPRYSQGQDFRLAYQFKILALSPFLYKKIFVDAKDGAILSVQELIVQHDVKALAHTKYSGMQNIVCDSVDSNLYTLIERGRGLDSIVIQNPKNPPSYLFYNTDTFWNNFNSKKDEVEGDVIWATEKTYDFFKEKFGRNSFDNKGHSITAVVHSGTNNASWMNGGVGIANFGDGDSVNYSPWASIDIVGHEITHGITQTTADLQYEKESGALSESFSDIFGKLIEYYNLPDSFSWEIGKPILQYGHLPVRSMNNPNLVDHPKYYKGKYYISTDPDDFYGVHTNCGVQNFWFYLLSEGGSGLREADSKPYFVHKIGMDTAGIISYYTLTNYLTQHSGFNDAAIYSLAAARLLFGDSSRIAREISNAWYAVGVLNTTGINSTFNSIQASKLEIYPNPTDNIFFIRSQENLKKVQFRLYNIIGKEVLVDFVSDQTNVEVRVDLSPLTSGLYFVEAIDEKGVKYIYKVIKK